MRTALGAFAAAVLFLAGVLVGLGGGGVDRPAPAVVELRSGTQDARPDASPSPRAPRPGDVERVEREVEYGDVEEYEDEPEEEEAEEEHEDRSGPGGGGEEDDTSGRGGGEDDSSGPGGGEDDSSGPGDEGG